MNATTTARPGGRDAPPGAVPLTVATIREHLASQPSLADSLAGTGKRRVVLLRSTPTWDGPAETDWGEGDRSARIAAAPSPLAVHELVLEQLDGPGPPDQRPAGPAVLVVLTDREQRELDPAILARVHKQRVDQVDGWDVVRRAFDATQVDPRLKDHSPWAAEALLDAAPPHGGWPAVPGRLLSRRVALSSLALRRLGLGRYAQQDGARPGPAGDDLDIHTLLRWSLTPGGPERLLQLREPERKGLAAFLAEREQAGAPGRALLLLVAQGHGPKAVAFGLVCAALWGHAEPVGEVYRSRGRAERWFGDRQSVSGEELDVLALAFGQAAEEFVVGLLARPNRDGPAASDEARGARRDAATVLEQARQLVTEFGAERAAEASPVLRAGLEARFAAVGTSLAAGGPAAAAEPIRRLAEHRLADAPDTAPRLERARMAQRLARWLATDPPLTLPDASFADLLDRHIDETGWVDRALEHIRAGGDPQPALGAAYDSIGASVRERRRGIDRDFARRLAAWTEAGTGPGTMLTVETFLESVVRPLARQRRRVLLVVLDGMSAAIACELAEELRDYWAEYDPYDDGRPRRRAMAAALPTTTAVSRTSLFAGRLMTGGQADEKQIFPTHRLWGGAPAAVFHKDDLRADSAGSPFSPALVNALSDGRTHVAVVLNTVDDRLGKEQRLGNAAWRVDEIGALRALMQTAAAEGMAVLLTSDHGHVVDRRDVRVDAAEPSSARHRVPSDAVGEPEIELSGPRVVRPEPGASIVALWDADSRYTAQRAGYHGGASPAEFTIPILAYLPYGAEPPKGWRELGDTSPPWWSLGPGPAPSAAGAAPAVPPARKKPVRTAGKAHAELAQTHDPLFDAEALPVPAAPQPQPPASDDHHTLVTALMAGELYKAQAGLLARRTKEWPAQVERALLALLDAGTLPVTALAQRAGLPTMRGDGFAAVLRQLLNYDGVQVLEILPDGRTVRLHEGLLREQFGLL